MGIWKKQLIAYMITGKQLGKTALFRASTVEIEDYLSIYMYTVTDDIYDHRRQNRKRDRQRKKKQISAASLVARML